MSISIELIDPPSELDISGALEIEAVLSNDSSNDVTDSIDLLVNEETKATETVALSPDEEITVSLSCWVFPHEAGEATVRIEGESSNSTVDIEITTPDGYYIYIFEPGDTGPGSAYVVDEVESVNPVREHTAISDWTATVTEDIGLEDWALEEALIYFEDEFLFHGFLERVQTDESAGETTISGRDVAKELTDMEGEVSFQETAVYDAIDEVWDQVEDWDVEVHEPEAEEQQELTLQEASTSGEWETVVDIDPTDPFEISDDSLVQLPSCYHKLGQDYDRGSEPFDDDGTPFLESVGGRAAHLYNSFYENSYDITTEYTIPDGHAVVDVRYFWGTLTGWEDRNLNWRGIGHEIILEGESVESFSPTTSVSYNPQNGVRQYMNGVSVPDGDYTDEANDESEDSIPLITENTEEGDYLYFNGTDDPIWWDELIVEMDQPGSGDWELEWQYHAIEYGENRDGDIEEQFEEWRPIPDVSTDLGSPEFTESGSVVFDLEDINSDLVDNDNEYTIWEPSSGSSIEIRAEVVSVGNVETEALANRIMCRANPTHINTNNSYSGELSAGTQTIDFEVTEQIDDGTYFIDYLTIRDDRFEYDTSLEIDWETQTAPGPEAYADSATLEFNQVETTLNILEAEIESTWNNTSNSQGLGLSIDGGTTWSTANNTETFAAAWEDAASRTIKSRLTASRYTVESDETPTEGNAGQVIEDWSLTIIGDELAVIEDQSFTGDYLQILQELHDFGNMNFTVLHQPDGERKAESYGRAQVERDADWEVRSRTREVDAADFKNHVIVRGARDEDGVRYRAEEENEDLIEEMGRYTLKVTDPSLETPDDCQSRARTLLVERIREGELTGTLDISPKLVDPGYLYEVEEWGTALTAETVSYQESLGEAEGQVDFVGAEGLAGEIVGLRGSTTMLTENV